MEESKELRRLEENGIGKYYVIDRCRCAISLAYVREYLDKGRFKYFDTYKEAYGYMKKACFDDSDSDVFYRTEDDKFLRICGCLE